MKYRQGVFCAGFKFLALSCLALALTACQTSQVSEPTFGSASSSGSVSAQANPTIRPASDISGRLRIGELLQVTYTDLPTPVPPFEGRIKEDGKITLMLNQEFVAAGKTIAELEKEIHARYVPKYFVNLTVTVKAQERFFYVDGQVRAPSRQPYLGEIRLLGAIAAAGGFTDFAQQKKVKIIRANGRIEVVNCKRVKENPALDVPIYPGDTIYVPRKLW